MMMLILIIILYISNVILERLSGKRWIKYLRNIVAVILLLYVILQTISSYQNSSYAYVSSNGNIVKRHNFPWKIAKVTLPDSNYPVYFIENRYGEPSEIKIKPNKQVHTEVYSSPDGTGIRFSCKTDEVPNFKIEIGSWPY
jgi:hypothetical protein